MAAKAPLFMKYRNCSATFTVERDGQKVTLKIEADYGHDDEFHNPWIVKNEREIHWDELTEDEQDAAIEALHDAKAEWSVDYGE